MNFIWDINKSIENVLKHDLQYRLMGFGFNPEVVDGHDYEALHACLAQKPQIVIANTIKGKGIKCMEGQAKFHYRLPTEEELNG